MAAISLFRHLNDSASDADLLRRFTTDRDADAFAELVRRHGPVVYRVCRRLIGPSAADDAFQATFLILATRSHSVRKAASVGSWLVGVAGRVARQMRKRERRFPASRERQRPEGLSPVADAPGSPELVEQFRILDEELTRLPNHLRGPVVLCLLLGRTQEQAVAELGGSVRTIRRRLEEAKQLLRVRLERRGVVPAVAAGLVMGMGEAAATVPPDLAARTVTTIFDFLVGGLALSAPAAVIAKGVAMGTLARKVKLAMLSAAVGLTGLGIGMAGDDQKPANGQTHPPTSAALPTAPLPESSDTAAKDRIPSLDRAQTTPSTIPPQAPTTDASSRYSTENFVVDAPTRELAKKFGESAERYRKEKALDWLGYEMPRWLQKCPLRVQITLQKTGGATTFTFGRADDKPAVASQEMAVFGEPRQLLTSVLPHEVTHTVLAHHFGQAVPRWADEGAAVMSESAEERHNHDAKCRETMNQGRGIPLRVLFSLQEYPRDMQVLFVQGYSVCRFLIEKGGMDGKKKFLRFVREGMKDGNQNWDVAARFYGFADVGELQEAWVKWLRQLPQADDGSRKPMPAKPNESEPPRLPPPTRPAQVGLRDGWPVGLPGVTHTLGEIKVTAKSDAIARAIAHEVDHLHREYSRRWLGVDPQPGSLPLIVKFAPVGLPNHAYGLHAKIGADTPRTVIDGIPVSGLEEVLETSLRPGVLGAIIYERAGPAVPECLRFGIAAQVISPNSQATNDRLCRTLLRRGQGISLSYLFSVRNIEQSKLKRGEVTVALAQGFSVVRYLNSLKGERAIIRFLEVGMKSGWPTAVKEVYGIESIDRLQAAWIDWLSTDKSRAGLPAQVGNISSDLDEEFLPRIPPVKLPGGLDPQPDRVGRIVIEGNTTVADKVILDQLGMVPGEAIPQLGKGRDNLVRLGLFDPASPPTIEQIPRHDGSGLIDFRVRVKELQKDK